MRIVRKVVSLPKPKGSVQAVFRRALSTAHKEKWSKIIIIGQGKNAGNYYHTSMLDHTAIGMLEKVKHLILTDD